MEGVDASARFHFGNPNLDRYPRWHVVEKSLVLSTELSTRSALEISNPTELNHQGFFQYLSLRSSIIIKLLKYPHPIIYISWSTKL